MKTKKNIDEFTGQGLQFHAVEYVIEIFPSPIPDEIDDMKIESEGDLFRMSSHEGYEELFVPSSEVISAESGDKTYEFHRNEFLIWQLARMSSNTIYQLISKTSANLTGIFDFDEEFDKDKDYDPESWLNSCETGDGNYKKGLQFIERLKSEASDEFYKVIVGAILDPDFGVLEYLETEIDENLDEIRELYGHWDVPLMIVSKGKFFPYIGSEFDSNLSMDDFRIQRMYVRNFNEGKI
jgi:hypothetical protein